MRDDESVNDRSQRRYSFGARFSTTRLNLGDKRYS